MFKKIIAILIVASPSGASSLRYFGNPTLGDVNTSGSSSLNKG
jgi:hypothetical protein